MSEGTNIATGETLKPINMETEEDLNKQRDICILKCPFCENNFIIPFVYRTHLAAHISFHSKEDIFSCKICPWKHLDLIDIVLHVEKFHSEKRRQNPNSALVKDIEQENLDEKYRMISELGVCDDQTFPLKLPY